jgi:hypothetical protein
LRNCIQQSLEQRKVTLQSPTVTLGQLKALSKRELKNRPDRQELAYTNHDQTASYSSSASSRHSSQYTIWSSNGSAVLGDNFNKSYQYDPSTSIPQTTSSSESSQTMSNPTQNPTSTPKTSIANNNNPTSPQSTADPSPTEDILMQDPDTSSHNDDKLIDTIIASLRKARAKEARLRTEIASLETSIAPLENDPEFPLPEDMKKSTLTRYRVKLLKAQRRLRCLLQKEFKAAMEMSKLLGAKLAVMDGKVRSAEVRLQGMRTWRSGRTPIAPGAARRSGPAPLGGWGNMMPVTSHAEYAARQRTEVAEPAEGTD